jgi:ribonuclease III
LGLFGRKRQKEEDQGDNISQAIRNIFGFKPSNVALYRLAFRHKSVATHQNNGFRHSNERLEYLGDAVLGSVIADFLFKKFPYKDEGFLTEIRSRIVSRHNLNSLSRKLGLDKLVQTSRENQTLGTSVLGDAFEAFIGAIYLDKGYRFTYNTIVTKIIHNHLDLDDLVSKEVNFKSKLIEWAQKERKNVEFELAEEIEDSKKIKIYVVNVLVDKEVISTGKDYAIKKAEQNAAEIACIKIFSENYFSDQSTQSI